MAEVGNGGIVVISSLFRCVRLDLFLLCVPAAGLRRLHFLQRYAMRSMKMVGPSRQQRTMAAIIPGVRLDSSVSLEVVVGVDGVVRSGGIMKKKIPSVKSIIQYGGGPSK